MVDATSLLPGLRPASFRGVTFWIEDAQQPVGRRALATYFPGTDIKVHDDFGVFDGPFRISGLVVGDDYVGQAEALKAAFQTPGPSTFVHPWLGPKTCVVIRPAEISFASDELRVARIEVEFDPVSDTGGFGASLGRVLGLLGLISGISRSLGSLGLLGGALSALSWSSGLASVGSVIGIVSNAASTAVSFGWDDLATGRAMETLTVAQAMPVSLATAVLAIDAMAEHADAAGLVWRAPPVPAIAPAVAIKTAIPDPRTGAASLLGSAAAISALPMSFPSSQAVLIAAEFLVIGQAAQTMLDIPFASRQEAFGWLARIDNACAGLAQRLIVMARDKPSLANPAMALLAELRGALAADINEIAGRLPSVTLIEIDTPIPAILIAQHLVGDDPRRIEPFVRDMVARNRIRHSGRISGRIEVLL